MKGKSVNFLCEPFVGLCKISASRLRCTLKFTGNRFLCISSDLLHRDVVVVVVVVLYLSDNQPTSDLNLLEQ